MDIPFYRIRLEGNVTTEITPDQQILRQWGVRNQYYFPELVNYPNMVYWVEIRENGIWHSFMSLFDFLNFVSR